MTNRGGKGRPNKAAYVTSWGETIEGVYKGKDGKIRPIGRSSPAYSLNNEQKAVHKIKQWKAKQDEAEIIVLDLEESRKHDLQILDDLQDFRYDPQWNEFVNYGRKQSHLELKRLRRLILENPQQAAIELDIPHLAFYPEVPEKPEFTLIDLGKHYLENKRNNMGGLLSKKHRENSGRCWNEFVSFVGVKYARDLTPALLDAFYNAVMKKFDTGMSPSWVRARFTTVKTVLKWGIDRTRDKEDCQKALLLCGILKPPADDVDPSPISPSEFNALFKKSDLRMKAVLLLGLNCLMHSGEIAKTLKSDIDFGSQKFYARRSKNNKRRVAYLWSRTIESIKAYQETTPNNETEYLFVSRYGAKLTGEAVRQAFVTLRRKVGLAEDVTLEGLRDAGYTIAANVDTHFAKVIAGHALKDEVKKYVKRDLNSRIIECCEAIETEFFASTE